MAPARVEDLLARSRFIFRGTVERLNAATMDAVPLTDTTAVVKVDEVFQAPSALGDQTGREITVQLSGSQPAQVGQQAVFFTNPWLYGESIAVQELDRREVGEEASRLRRQLADGARRQPDQALQQRLTAAEGVVVGTVSNNRPVMPGGSQPVSEHDPQWWEAMIAVEGAEKGDFAPRTVVTVLFANSMDVMWFQAPKLRVGQEGIWLLHRQEIAELRLAAYAVLDPLDAQPRDQFDRVQRLLRGGQASRRR